MYYQTVNIIVIVDIVHELSFSLVYMAINCYQFVNNLLLANHYRNVSNLICNLYDCNKIFISLLTIYVLPFDHKYNENR